MPQARKHTSHAARQAAYRARCQQAHAKQMQTRGLPALPALPAMPGTSRWNAALKMAHALIEEVVSQMQDYFDERSESWQEGERGEEYQGRLALVEAALDAVGELTP